MAQKQAIFTMLGGRVRMFRGEYNATSDAAWLAAFVPEKIRTVLDVGIGTGGVGLCLNAHNPNIKLTGIDISDKMLTECARNAELNNCDIELINADIMSWRTPRTFDAVITNPPYFTGTPANHNAHHNTDIIQWTRKCIARVRPRGYCCIIIDASRMSDAVFAMRGANCGDITIVPLFGAKQNAERVLIRCRIGTGGGDKLYNGLPMNYEPVLRDGLTINSTLARLGWI